MYQQGNCPKCNSTNLTYDTIIDLGFEGMAYPIQCNNCDFCGQEWYNVEFAYFTNDNGEIIN